ncbi:hypothetical protein EZS27_013096 [termite gut metagenome]|uniref:Uncharacterized protein n=1 Tax=termite gut metagenome TaxID=433724 RepID=A0A5J4RYS6_9ZZZZ
MLSKLIHIIIIYSSSAFLLDKTPQTVVLTPLEVGRFYLPLSNGLKLKLRLWGHLLKIGILIFIVAF